MELLTVSKVISMLCLGLVTWLVGLFPLIGVKKGWIKSSDESQSRTTVILISCLLSFGGGVILTSCLTHMLPDVNEVLGTGTGSLSSSEMPIAEILVLAGFLLIYLLEESVHLILEKANLIVVAGNHGHSHDDMKMPVEEGVQAVSRGFLVVLALCIHDFFEGIALGVAKNPSEVWFLLLAFASHKWVISGTLGINWARSAMSWVVAAVYMTAFCGISPVGIAVGMALRGAEETQSGDVLVVFQGLATGSLLYVVFFEILEKERKKDVPGILQALSLTFGYIFMVLLGLAEVASEHTQEVSETTS